MDSFLEQLLNAAYQVYQRRLTTKYGSAACYSPIIKFGGFQYTHDWLGKVDLSYDKIDDLIISTKTIYFNFHFLQHQFGLIDYPKYNLKSLIKNMAHELTHCLLANYNPWLARLHSPLHDYWTADIEKFLWDTYEVNLLAKLTGFN